MTAITTYSAMTKYRMPGRSTAFAPPMRDRGAGNANVPMGPGGSTARAPVKRSNFCRSDGFYQKEPCDKLSQLGARKIT